MIRKGRGGGAAAAAAAAASGSAAASKEPAARKTSGLAHLMSALHQNAAAVVTSNSQLNGPDQILPAEGLTTSRRNGCVRLRREEHGLGSEEPISIPTMFRDISEAYSETVALRAKRDGLWHTWTYEQYFFDVRLVSRAFIHLGLHRHHSVVILGRNSPEWFISNLAAVFAGGISVGLHNNCTTDDIAKAAIDAKADVIVVETPTMLKKILLIQHKLPELKAIVQCKGEPELADKRRLHRSHKKHILSWEQLLEIGQDLPESRLDDRLKRIAINQCCSIVYSAEEEGSAPKGVMLSHDNITWCSKMLLGFIRAPGFNRLPSPGEEVLLSYLPHSCVAAHIIDIYYSISIAGTVNFYCDGDVLNDSQAFFDAIAETQPTVFFAPPFVYEKIYHRLREMRRNMTGLQRFFLDWSNNTLRESNCRRGHSGRQAATTPSRKLGQWQTCLAKNTVCRKYREMLGFVPRTVFLACGDPMVPTLLNFLAGFDIVVHESFGQPENCGILTANIPKRYCKLGTSGKTVPGVKLRLDPHPVPGLLEAGDRQVGQICAWGRNLFMGYLNHDCETRDVFVKDDEVKACDWFRLDELGFLDDDGFLVSLGSEKDLVHLASGEALLPSQIEQLVRIELPCVKHSVVVGQGQDSLAVLLTLHTKEDEFASGQPGTELTEDAQRWFRHARYDMRSLSDVVENMEGGLQFAIQAGIDRANQGCLSTAHLIKQWRLLSKQLTYQNGELTHDGKLIRSVIQKSNSICLDSVFCSSGAVCTDGTTMAARPQTLLQQLSQIQEEDESKTSSRNSIDQDKERPQQQVIATVIAVHSNSVSDDNTSSSGSSKGGGRRAATAIAEEIAASGDNDVIKERITRK